MKKAFITGITGQDGSYLAELLLTKGYQVHGLIRRASTLNTERIDHLYHDESILRKRLRLYHGDITDPQVLRRIFDEIEPDEVYNLAAQSHVKVSFYEPHHTAQATALGTLSMLEILRDYCDRTGRVVKFYQAGSSEMFGAAAPPQSESTPFYPRSPYGVSKLAAHWYGVNYREAYGLFICNGILFNHESPRRGETFVTRKITRAVGRIRAGLQKELVLGNLDAKRDWGFAGDYVDAMWRMLQHPVPGDYVVATGEAYSVREFLDESFSYAELDWHEFVRQDPQYFRQTEVDFLQGDSTRAREVLGWMPRVTFRELVRMMVDHDSESAAQETTLRAAGHQIIQRGQLLSAHGG
ncbi:MAG: GDP-mannose 4,6-dehydratase [Lacisediminihabitans sp.]